MKNTIAFLFTFLPFWLSAQINNFVQEDEWFEGAIYDLEGKSQSGQINYNYALNNIRFKSNDQIKIHTTHSISSFDIMVNGKLRSFHVIPYIDPTSGRSTDYFFELLYRNENYCVFSKHKLITNTIVMQPGTPTSPNQQIKLESRRSALNHYVNDAQRSAFGQSSKKTEIVLEELFIADKTLALFPVLACEKENQRTMSEKKVRKKIEKGKMMDSALTTESKNFYFVDGIDFSHFFHEEAQTFMIMLTKIKSS